MIPIESCPGCGRLLIIVPVGNLVVRLETDALDAQTAAQALLGGRGLWRVTQTAVKPAKPAELSALARRGNVAGPHIAQEHSCTGKGLNGPLSASRKPGPTAPPKAPPAARTTPSWGLQGASVDDAETQASSAQLIIDTLGATLIREIESE